MGQERRVFKVDSVPGAIGLWIKEMRATADMCNQLQHGETTGLRQRSEELERKLEQRLDELREDVLELKDIRREVCRFEEPRWVPEDTRSIQHAVIDLHSTIRSWAEEYGTNTFKVSIPTDNSTQEWNFFHDIRSFSIYNNAEQLSCLWCPFALLAGALFDFIRKEIFEKLLFHFQEVSEEYPSCCSRILGENYLETPNAARVKLTRDNFPNDASPWTVGSRIGELLVPKRASREALESVYDELEIEFSSRIPPWLWDPRGLEQDRRVSESLTRILKKAGNLHFRLLTQRASFVWDRPDHCAGRRFRVENDTYTACVICGTALFAHSDALGEDYPKHRMVVADYVAILKAATPSELPHQTQEHHCRS